MEISFRRTGAGLALSACCALSHADNGGGLTIDADSLHWPRWQGRIAVGTVPAWRPMSSAPFQTGPATSRFSVMADYYLTRSGPGPGLAGGLRATSGVLVALRMQPVPGAGSAGGPVDIERRPGAAIASLALGESAAESPTLPYLGIGYTGQSPRGGWSFRADLGVVSLSPGGAVKLGRVFTGSQSLDDAVRDMRWSPLLQLGVSYAF